MIRFNRHYVTGNELTYISQALDSAKLSGDGPFGRKCEEVLQDELGVLRAMMTPSCTDALELSALLLDLKEGDEVILPTFTFVSSASAFALRGAQPVFADIRSDTLNLDEASLPDLFSDRTRVVVPVHYAGVGCAMDDILELCTPRGVAIVEDNAHGLFGELDGQKLGTFGQMSTLSFHDTKNFSCGEGGALILNDASLVRRAEILREKGTDRAAFFRGEVDKYSWVDVGSSFLPSEFQMAVLLAQLEARAEIQQSRKRVWDAYYSELEDWATQNGCRLPHVPEGSSHPSHMFYLILPDLEQRTRFIRQLREQGIWAPFHYVPLHLSEQGRRLGGREGQCPVAESLSERLVRLPLYAGLTEEDQARVVESVLGFEVES